MRRIKGYDITIIYAGGTLMEEKARQDNLEYWNQLSPLERYTLTYAAYYGLAQALDLLASIIDDIQPGPFRPRGPMLDAAPPQAELEWKQQRVVFALAQRALYRNGGSPLAGLRRALRKLMGAPAQT